MPDWRSDRHASRGSRESTGDARQGGHAISAACFRTAKTALTLYSDPLVARNTSASDFTINDLVNHERPVSLYLVVPPSDKIRLRPLIRLMFTMVVNRLTERMVFRRRRAEAQQASAAAPDRRVSHPEPHGDLRRRALLHGRLWLESVPDHAGHPADRGRVRHEREHRLELPRAHRVRTEPVRDGGVAVEDDRHARPCRKPVTTSPARDFRR